MLEKTLKRLLTVSIITLIIVAFIGVVISVKREKTEEEISFGGQAGNIVDVVGTRIGTTTTAVSFSNNSATTTYPILLGREYDTAIFNIKAKTFETGGGNNAHFSILASNDFNCDTASTTTTMDNVVVKSDINWFDAGRHLMNLAGSKTLDSGTSTIVWIPLAAGDGTVLGLENLNYNCLALQTTASGTAMWIQLERKNLAR